VPDRPDNVGPWRLLKLVSARKSDVREESATPKKHHDMLSTRLLQRPACQLLSPRLAKHALPTCHSPSRAFHASTPRQDPVLDAVLYLPHEMMNIIHTSVPWYAAIPLSAFIARAALVTTFGAWSRSLMARYIGLHPLRQALAFQKRDEILKRGNFRTPQEATLVVKKEVKKEIDELDKRWKVSLTGQIGWTVGQIPIFFAMAETIRQKCAARDGLLGLGFSAFRSEDAQTAVGEVAVTGSKWFEPSLATEGMLWFPDLLMADPTGVLPYIVSGLMFSNIYFTKNAAESGPSWSRGIRIFLLGLSLCVGPLCQNLPAALLLYWGSSTTSVILWNAWLDWRYPAPRGYTACKRPLQMPPKFAPTRVRKLSGARN
jgi:inner membrane protein COX18